MVININKFKYDKLTDTLWGSEKDIPFDTSYEVFNSATLIRKTFEFSHSTGPEFDPNTKWVYKCKGEDLTLVICNDKLITEQNAENYLNAKLKR